MPARRLRAHIGRPSSRARAALASAAASLKMQCSCFGRRLAQNKWSDWFRLSDAGKAPPGAPVAAISTVPGGTSLFLVDLDGAVQSSFFDPQLAQPKWSDWFRLSDAGKAPPSAPVAAISTIPGGTSLFLVDLNGPVQSSYFDPTPVSRQT